MGVWVREGRSARMEVKALGSIKRKMRLKEMLGLGFVTFFAREKMLSYHSIHVLLLLTVGEKNNARTSFYIYKILHYQSSCRSWLTLSITFPSGALATREFAKG